MKLHYWVALFLFSFLGLPLAEAKPMLKVQKPVIIAQSQNQKVTEQSVKVALPQLEKLANEVMKQTGVPGMAIAIVYQDRIVYLKGFGIREVGKPDLVDPDTVFALASVSKPIASTVIAGVVGKGLIEWDDPIIRHDPSFQMNNAFVTREVTFRDLLAHRSGLPDHAGDDLEDLGFDRTTILHRLRYLPTGNNFRSHYAYTNFGFTEAAVAAAKSTGTEWEDLCFKTLYQPLGMNNTSSRYADLIASKNRALGHIMIKGQWVAQDQRTPDAQSPAGGVSSSVRDMAQWMRLQLGNGFFNGLQIINAEALADTHRPQMISNPPQNPSTDQAGFYGLGWGIKYTDEGLVRLSHSGAFNLGAATTVYLLPSEGLGIVVLTNSRPIGVPETIALSFLDLVQYGQIKRDYLELLQSAFAALDQPSYGTLIDYTKPPTQPLPALSHNSYIGTYQNDYFGEIEIVEQDGKLILLQGAQKKAFPLQHYERDVFIYQPEGENAFGLSAVTFTVGADGKGTNVMIENLNILEQGSFNRVLLQK